jgi:hypothetical protein
MADNSAFLILRWLAIMTRNSLVDVFKAHKIDLVVTIITVALAGMYLTEAIYSYIIPNAVALRAAWPAVSMSAFGVSALLGSIAGWWTIELMLKYACAAWTAPLPILMAARLKSAGVAAFAFGVVEAAPLGLGWSIICISIGVEHPGIDGLLVAASFMLGFTGSLICRYWSIYRTPLPDRQSRDAVVLQGLRYASERGRLTGWESGLFDIFVALDQITPRWIGRWVTDNGVVLRAAGGIGLLCCLAVFAAVSSLVQNNAAPVLIVGTVAGHAAFIATFRSDPLASPTLRCSTLNFIGAWAGLVRLPLVVSFGVFVPWALVGLVAEPIRWTIILASAPALLVANGMYSLISANVPSFHATARIAHAVALMLVFKGAFELNTWIALPIATFLVLGWQSARRRYRAYP